MFDILLSLYYYKKYLQYQNKHLYPQSRNTKMAQHKNFRTNFNFPILNIFI